jgi:hypothetical protein
VHCLIDGADHIQRVDELGDQHHPGAAAQRRVVRPNLHHGVVMTYRSHPTGAFLSATTSASSTSIVPKRKAFVAYRTPVRDRYQRIAV